MRDFTILVLMLDTGLRASEVCWILLMHVNLEKGCIKVMGKGAKERIVPIGEYTRKTLQHYLEQYRAKLLNSNSEALFLTVQGRPMTVNARS